jgi:hypothetical protein
MDSVINAAAAESAQQSQGLLCRFAFDSGDQHYTTRAHPVTWDGDTYLPVGPVSVEAITEAADSKPSAIRLTLSGVDANFINLALDGEEYINRRVYIYRGWFSEQDVLLDDPEGPIIATISHPEVVLGNENAMSLVCETAFARWAKAKPLAWTTATQQRFWSGDKFFDRGPLNKDRTIMWGGQRLMTGGGGGRGGPAPRTVER